MTKAYAELNNPREDKIICFLNRLIDKFPGQEYLYSEEFYLHDVDKRFIQFLIGSFHTLMF